MGKEYGKRKKIQFCTYLIIPASPSVQLSSYVSNQLLRTRGGFLSVSLLQGRDSTGATSTLPGGTQLLDAVSSHGISSGEGQVWVLCSYSASSTRAVLAVTWGSQCHKGQRNFSGAEGHALHGKRDRSSEGPNLQSAFIGSVDILIAGGHRKDSFRPFLRDLQTSAETPVSHYCDPAAWGGYKCPQQTPASATLMFILTRALALLLSPAKAGCWLYPDTLHCAWRDSPLSPGRFWL